ncbi:MAG: hypothetical protein BMS9Abin07_0261 [Acidimicrobiia bacterium]|nr:MAG: hypothetical protein BMS9Abin07_0261 [Acidimicrobiia bacterium]
MAELTTEAHSAPVAIQTVVLGFSSVAATPTGLTRAAMASQNSPACTLSEVPPREAQRGVSALGDRHRFDRDRVVWPVL